MDKRINEINNKVEITRSKIVITESIQHLLKQIRNSYLNGGVILERFEIKNFEHINRNPEGWNEVVWTLIKHKSIYKQITNHDLEIKTKQVPSDFTAVSSFELLSQISGILNHGGAYSKLEDRPNDKESVNLAWKSIKDLFTGELSSYHLYKTYTPWLNWHYGVAWDYSLFMFGKGYKELTILLITDTD